MPRLHSIASLCFVALTALVGCGEASAARSQTWSVGSRYLYDVHLVSAAASGSTSGAPLFDFDLRGELAVTPLSRSEQGTQLMLSFTRAAFTSRQGTTHEAQFARVAEELQRRHAFTFEHGIQASSRIGNDAQALTVGILRNLAAHLQFPPRPDDLGDRATWQALEYDATGQYVAEYTVTGDQRPEPRVFSRRKVGYRALLIDERLRSQLIGTQVKPPTFSESSGLLLRDGQVTLRFDSHERLDLELLAGHKMSTTTALELRLNKRVPAEAVDRAEFERETTLQRADQAYAHASSVFDLDAAKIGERTFDEVISALETNAEQRNDGAEPAPSSPPSDMRSFTALSAMLRKRPADIDRAVAVLRGGSPATPAILSSLGAAGSESAQRALVILINDRKLPAETRKAAAFSLLRTKTPTVETAQVLVGMLHDPLWRAQAVLGLGTFVRRFSESGEIEAATRFGDALVAELQRSTSDQERADVLIGLSNSAYMGALDTIRRYLVDDAPQVRAAAVQALRLMPEPSVDRLIIERLSTDPAYEARLGALTAAQNRPFTPELGAAVASRLRRDDDSTVRMQALQLLGAWLDEQPSVRVAIEAAKDDSSEAVRKSAASLLQRG